MGDARPLVAARCAGGCGTTEPRDDGKYSQGVDVQEFYEQGDLEKHLGLEPLPFMIRDTHKTAYSNNQKVGSPLRPPRLLLTLAHICIATGPAPAEDRPSRCRRLVIPLSGSSRPQ